MLPFLYALQFYPDNKPQAMALARLIADIEPVPNPNMGFMFCPRFDATIDSQVEAMVRAKFPFTSVYQTRNQVVGWPRGCNAQAHEVYTHFHNSQINPRPGQPQYCAILMGESDCVPLAKDWIAKLQWEWHNCDWNWRTEGGKSGNEQLVLGHWLTGSDVNCGVIHINGNCMISPKFLNAYPAFRHTTAGAWDTTHATAMRAFGRPSKLIFSDYNLGRPENPWKGCDSLWRPRRMHPINPLGNVDLFPVYLHGCKGMEALSCVRQRLVENQTNARLPSIPQYP